MSLYTYILICVLLIIVIQAVATATILENQNKLFEKIDELIQQLKEKEEK